jgi:hypothetical protein
MAFEALVLDGLALNDGTVFRRPAGRCRALLPVDEAVHVLNRHAERPRQVRRSPVVLGELPEPGHAEFRVGRQAVLDPQEWIGAADPKSQLVKPRGSH